MVQSKEQQILCREYITGHAKRKKYVLYEEGTTLTDKLEKDDNTIQRTEDYFKGIQGSTDQEERMRYIERVQWKHTQWKHHGYKYDIIKERRRTERQEYSARDKTKSIGTVSDLLKALSTVESLQNNLKIVAPWSADEADKSKTSGYCGIVAQHQPRPCAMY
jgi:hypothetical protein